MRNKNLLGYALRLLGKRDYSRQELAGKLSSRGSVQQAQEVLAYLEKKGLIQDEELASRLVKEKLASGHGWLYIQALLERKGFPSWLINQLAADFDYQQELAVAREYLARKLKRGKKVSELSLKSRGFSAETLKKLRKEMYDTD